MDLVDFISCAKGVDNVAGTTARTAQNYCAVQCLTACTFTTFTENGAVGAWPGGAIEVAAGTTLINMQGITAVTASAGNLWRGIIKA